MLLLLILALAEPVNRDSVNYTWELGENFLNTSWELGLLSIESIGLNRHGILGTHLGCVLFGH